MLRIVIRRKENFAIEIRETSESEVETINKSEIKEIL